MSTITQLQGSTPVTTAGAAAIINQNFANLNSDKQEASGLDTDNTLGGATPSDTKYPSQKAVKNYADTGGNVNASETAKGIVEEATDAEVTAGTATGATGAKLFVTPAKLLTNLSSSSTAPVVNIYTTVSTYFGTSTTQFDITNPSGTTFRYTFDGTGTDPGITAVTIPTGAILDLQGQNFAAGNKGVFLVTSSGASYFEITNGSGVAENNKTIGTGYLVKGTKWTKPAGLKYVVVEVQAGGGGGGSAAAGGAGANKAAGGGGGGYSKEKINASSLGTFEIAKIGVGGTGQVNGGAAGTAGGTSYFGTLLSATGGSAAALALAGAGGIGSNGDINATGSGGGGNSFSNGQGGNSLLGGGGIPAPGGTSSATGGDGGVYGGAGGGAVTDSFGGAGNGGAGAQGVVIIEEHYV